MIELLNFEEHDEYMRKLERYNLRESIHNESMKRRKEKRAYEKFKIIKFGRKPIG